MCFRGLCKPESCIQPCKWEVFSNRQVWQVIGYFFHLYGRSRQKRNEFENELGQGKGRQMTCLLILLFLTGDSHFFTLSLDFLFFHILNVWNKADILKIDFNHAKSFTSLSTLLPCLHYNHYLQQSWIKNLGRKWILILKRITIGEKKVFYPMSTVQFIATSEVSVGLSTSLIMTTKLHCISILFQNLPTGQIF